MSTTTAFADSTNSPTQRTMIHLCRTLERKIQDQEWYLDNYGEPNSCLLINITALQEALDEYQAHMTPTPGEDVVFTIQP